ncbi:MAG: hypothetical protein KDE53_15075 [Caldilineaceae bacterium]|nr:hypothetical protein [Caldilineaceae bacterium]
MLQAPLQEVLQAVEARRCYVVPIFLQPADRLSGDGLQRQLDDSSALLPPAWEIGA